ncbi:MAG: hypothetical protein JW795_03980 [Chitinivibrionales bacterium]|nr:hypothetical protein [Chitinivibrionales bacterium]
MELNYRNTCFSRHVRRFERIIARLKVIDNRFSVARLSVFLVALGAGMGGYFFVSHRLGWVLMAFFGLGFCVLVALHNRCVRSLRQYTILRSIRMSDMARINRDWEAIPQPSDINNDTSHPFASDLDITTDRSIHRLMDIAVSTSGSHRLASWLKLGCFDLGELARRQELIRELVHATRFRDRLRLIFSLNSDKRQLDGEEFLACLASHETPAALRLVLFISTLLASCTIATFVLWLTLKIPAVAWMFSFGVYCGIYFANGHLIQHLHRDSVLISQQLFLLRPVLRFLEHFPYRKGSRLREQCQPFLDIRSRPSRFWRHLSLLELFIGIRMNPLLTIALNAVMPWDFGLALFTALFKRKLHATATVWIETFGVLEAELSLSNFAYGNPGCHFPTLRPVSNDGTISTIPLIRACGLGHPLLPNATKVRNDFSIGWNDSIALITGSNMSGKSTFLKTIGINLCLALTGGVVDAAVFESIPLRLFTCMKVADSITDGYSFFYAEVRRLKALLDELSHPDMHFPLLYLIDEIFRGTNNRERLIGSRAYIQALTSLPGIGLIATHDLDLTMLSETVKHVRNYHFCEEIRESAMVFDYTLRKGPCQTTNALIIMKKEGLPIDVVHG